MALYFDAATVLTADIQEGSLKSRIYGGKLGIRSKPSHVYALISEAAKYDTFFKEVIDHADFLSREPKVCGQSLIYFVSLLTDLAILI
jgi:hypothetical protein